MAKYAARLCQPPITYEFELYRIIIGEHDHDPIAWVQPSEIRKSVGELPLFG